MKRFTDMNRSTLKKIAAITLAFVMILGSTAVLRSQNTASAEDTKVIVTSPFTDAIAQVRSSVVGIRNYQTVRYSNNSYGSGWDDFFNFGFGNFGNYGNYGNYGNDYGNNDQSRQEEVLAGTGSGVVIAPHYVLTNNHVVEDASSLKVTVGNEDSKEPDLYDAVVVATDENLDVAVVYAPDLELDPVALGDSDTLQVGDWAICIGNPLAERFYGTVTTGIVSALNRSVSSTTYDKYGRKEPPAIP